MISPLRNRKPPYSLPSGVVYFHDWRYVQPGRVNWRATDGSRVPMWTTTPIPPLEYRPELLPYGIRLRAQPARKTEPFLTPPMTDEMYLFAGTVIHADGRYRLWLDCWPTEHIGDPEHEMGSHNYVRYAESDDGETWRLPQLGLVERHGSTANNVVYGPPLTGATGYHGGCVFRDPAAAAAERYKMLYQGVLPPAMQATMRRERPEAIDAYWDGRGHMGGLFGATSPDGLTWTPLDRPLSAQVSDTHNVCEYDEALGQYVAYCRNWLFHRRGIGRIASHQFRDFPLSSEALWPSPAMAPDELWYVNAKTRMPDAPDYHVMFPMRWSIRDDRFDFCLATSPDNTVWNMVPGGPVCRPGDPGDWDGGVAVPGLGLVALPGARIGIPLVGTPVPHKHPRLAPLGAVAWAWWPTDRLVALEAEAVGGFALQALRDPGRSLCLNFRTSPGGCLRVAALDANSQPLPGRAFEDCQWLTGDQLSQQVAWDGSTDLGYPEGGDVVLAFELRCAQLFSARFE